jgi:glycosyltransferase involved in cell wall biosynthesis
VTAPLVTVVTATWRRPLTLLDRCIPSVEAQDYDGDVEHLVVADGWDPGLNEALYGEGYGEDGRGGRRLVQLGRNWSAPDVVHGGVGVIPRLVGAYLAAGEYVTYLDDDNAYLPHHVSALAGALESTGADFAVSRWHDGPGGPVAGHAPPGRGRTDTSSIMHRASTLRAGSWDHRVGYENDGALVEAWMAAGARWAFVDQPTFVLYPHRRGAPDPEPAP